MSLKQSNFLVSCIKVNSHQVFNPDHLKPFVIHSYPFTLMLSESSYSQLHTNVLHHQQKRKDLVDTLMCS